MVSCPDEPIPSGASLPRFISAMQQQAAHEYADSAKDPDWKVLSSPEYTTPIGASMIPVSVS